MLRSVLSSAYTLLPFSSTTSISLIYVIPLIVLNYSEFTLESPPNYSINSLINPFLSYLFLVENSGSIIYNLSTSKSRPAIVVISLGNIIVLPDYCGKKPLIYKGNIEYLFSVGIL